MIFLVPNETFRLPELQFPSNRRRVSTVHRLRTPFSQTYGSSQSLVKACSPGSRHLVRLIPRTRAAQAQHEVWYIVSCRKVFTSPRAMSYTTPLMSSTPSPALLPFQRYAPPQFPQTSFQARLNPVQIHDM